MKSQNLRPSVPHNGKLSQPSITKQVSLSSWDDQPYLSDEPDLPEQEINWDEIPNREESSSNIREPRDSFNFLADYWLNATNENSERCQLDGFECTLSYTDVLQEHERLLAERVILEYLSTEDIYKSMNLLRSLLVDLEIKSGYDHSQRLVCILIELVDNNKRWLDAISSDSFFSDINYFDVPNHQAIAKLSSLLYLLPSLYQVKEYISFPCKIGPAQAMELADFVYQGMECQAKISKVRIAFARLFHIQSSEASLLTHSSNNRNERKDRNQLLFIKNLKRKWELKHNGGIKINLD